MRRPSAIFGVLVLTAATLVLSPPAQAHRGDCWPQRLSHEQCHQVWRQGRELGVGKQTLRHRVWGHPKRVRSFYYRYRAQMECQRNCGESEQQQQQLSSTQSGGFSGCAKNTAKLIIRGRPLNERRGQFSLTKRWCWNADQITSVRVRTSYDITNAGEVLGLDYSGLQAKSDQYRRWNGGTRREHVSLRQPRFEVCVPGLKLLGCFRDLSPELRIRTRAFGICQWRVNDQAWRWCS